MADSDQDHTLPPGLDEQTLGVKPIGARLCVQTIAVGESVRDSGVVLPSTDSSDTYKANVLAIGDGVTYVHAGDLVLLTVGAVRGTTFLHQQETYAIIEERDVLAVLDRG